MAKRNSELIVADERVETALSQKESEIRVDGRPIENPYYMKIYRKFRGARFVSILALILFVLMMLTVYSSEITLENFKYLMKYLDINVITAPNEFQPVSYESGAEMDFAFYRGDFVVITESALNMYDQIGTLSVNSPFTTSTPTLVVSDQYLLAYDKGGYSYSVFNSFSMLYTTTMEYPISNAAVSDEGVYAIVSRNRNYLSVVYVYDKNFNLIDKIQKDKYVMSVDISDDGKKLLVFSMYGDTVGEFCGELQLFNIETSTVEQTVPFTDQMPLKAVFNENDGASLIFSDHLCFYDSDLQPLSSQVTFDGNSASHFVLGDRFSAIAVSENVVGYKSTVTMYGLDGAKIDDFRVSGQLTEMIACGDRFYLLTSNRLYVGSTDGSLKEIDVEDDALSVIASDDGEMIFVCYSNRAHTVDIPTEENDDDHSD